jgi:hypothetical protein
MWVLSSLIPCAAQPGFSIICWRNPVFNGFSYIDKTQRRLHSKPLTGSNYTPTPLAKELKKQNNVHPYIVIKA